jgi:hypothetical protein
MEGVLTYHLYGTCMAATVLRIDFKALTAGVEHLRHSNGHRLHAGVAKHGWIVIIRRVEVKAGARSLELRQQAILKGCDLGQITKQQCLLSSCKDLAVGESTRIC